MANTSFLSLWTIFGELQAKQARKEVTSGLVSRTVEWLAQLGDGIEGLHIRIHTQTRDVQSALSQVLGLIICDTLTSSASLGIALYYSWKLTLVLMSTLPVSLIVLALPTRNLDSEVLLQKQCLQSASTIAAASLSGIDIVRIFSGFDREQRTYARALRLAARHFLAQARCNAIQIGYVTFWSVSIFVLGFWYGLALVEQGLSPGHVVTTFYAVVTALHGVESFASHWLVLSKGKSAAHFLRHLAQSEKVCNTPAIGQGNIALHTCAGHLQLCQHLAPNARKMSLQWKLDKLVLLHDLVLRYRNLRADWLPLSALKAGRSVVGRDRSLP
ncbi:hypothetical protein E4U41_005643 [Claviceps citrina]|nr:hypothetical protein E4U41_005643 [Claviceps citrina]